MSELAAERPTWGRAWLLAAGTVWLPTLLPFVFGQLRDGHVLQSYARMLLAVPGLLPAVLLGLQGTRCFVVAAATSLALCSLVAVAVRDGVTPMTRLMQGVVIALVAVEAFGFAYVLPM